TAIAALPISAAMTTFVVPPAMAIPSCGTSEAVKRAGFKPEALTNFGGNPPTRIQLMDMLHCTLAGCRR
ncbi:MAG: hypothetical protein KDJ83_14955, partial [Rhodobacteraceae bacterium]|nr:hypothetical protein [Paracoccaceae bacterium]